MCSTFEHIKNGDLTATLQGRSSPFTLFRFPVTLACIVPPERIMRVQYFEKLFGKCPTISPSFVTLTACLSYRKTNLALSHISKLLEELADMFF